MKRTLSILLMLVALEFAGVSRAQPATQDAAIRDIAGRWEQAWNSHDMAALAGLFTEDADFVNVGARHWKGREDIEAQHAARLRQFVDSTWTTKDVAIQSLAPGVSLVHVAWALEGDRDPDGTPRPPREGVFTWVLVEREGKWQIRAAQNTNRGNLPAPAGTK